jgi:MFS family permease
MWVFILGRFIQGLAAGAMATIGLGAVAKEYPVRSARVRDRRRRCSACCC